MYSLRLAAALGLLLALCGVKLVADEVSKKPAAPEKAAPAPLSENAKRGLDYLVAQQDASGGWGQGGGWRQGEKGRVEGNDVKDPPDVGNTCIAALALIRSGSTPTSGPYAANVAKAVQFVTAQVEAADEKSIFVTNLRGTQLQGKIGQYVDTFLAGLLMSELKGRMPDSKSEARLLAALNKTVQKIEHNQKEDGTFAGNTGWASVLSQGLCSKALTSAKRAGVALNEKTLERDFNQTVASLDVKKGTFSAGGSGGKASLSKPGIATAAAISGPGPGPTDAGVEIYNGSANTLRLHQQAESAKVDREEARKVLAQPNLNKEAKAKAEKKVADADRIEVAQRSAVKGIASQLGSERFVAGFGNKGGEEFLSYMNISETLSAQGGKEWEDWQKKSAQTINAAQNADGSWSGSHCITGRTFCTSAALLTLMADRIAAPTATTAEKVASGK